MSCICDKTGFCGTLLCLLVVGDKQGNHLNIGAQQTLDLLQIQDALQRAAFDSNAQVGAIFQVLQTKELPPTYFRTNKFTSAFQEIVDAYG